MPDLNPLSHYCFYCSPAGVRKELRQGADPNEADAVGATPLMWLGEMYDRKHMRERKRIFRYLIEAGASLEKADSRGATVWDYTRHGAARGFRSFVRREIQRLTRNSALTRKRAGQ